MQGSIENQMQSPELDRETARALVDAGFMPLEDYVRMFGQPSAPPRRPVMADMTIFAQGGALSWRASREARLKTTLRSAAGWRATYR